MPAERSRAYLRWRTTLLLAVLAAVVVFVVVPQYAEVGAALRSIEQVTPWILGLVVALEAASLTAYSLMTRAVLPQASRPAFGVLLRIDLTGYGLSHVIPGGAAAAAGARYRLWTRSGISRRDGVSATAVETAVSVSALVLVFAVGTVVGLRQSGTPPALVAGAITGLTIVGTVGLGAVLLTVRPERVTGVIGSIAGRVPILDPAVAEAIALTLAAHVRDLLADRRRLARTSVWGVSNWVLDAAALGLALNSFGFSPNLWQLLAAYGLVNVLALLPVTPGGLGVVEGILVPTLVGIGAEPEQALLGVLTWRLVQFWLPIPVGLGCYLSLPRRRVDVAG